MSLEELFGFLFGLMLLIWFWSVLYGEPMHRSIIPEPNNMLPKRGEEE